jgi:zinc transport system substrate-binding protein
MRQLISLFILLLVMFVTSCGTQSEKKPAVSDSLEKIHVFVSILPQKYFVEMIGGGHVTVEALVGPGQSPHTFEPSPQQMTSLSKADIFFSIGFP